jgi:hypothetical protein
MTSIQQLEKWAESAPGRRVSFDEPRPGHARAEATLETGQRVSFIGRDKKSAAERLIRMMKVQGVA